MRVKWEGEIFTVLEQSGDWYAFETYNGVVEVHIDDLEEVEIECRICDEEKWVESGTWALDKGMCETCYCEYEGW
ncbi:hypothetical protein [Bacillus sp. UNC437CL72CviS29]|uniref:hypothetical protein n=1 Tax=Bacillus sp. UNC437CL72CviS29 TaxID=1340430 RepID=UPI000479D463|nr:hypothetical protein [Bacillus sp. UNC437CL72CviS29]